MKIARLDTSLDTNTGSNLMLLILRRLNYKETKLLPSAWGWNGEVSWNTKQKEAGLFITISNSIRYVVFKARSISRVKVDFVLLKGIILQNMVWLKSRRIKYNNIHWKCIKQKIISKRRDISISIMWDCNNLIH